MTFYPFFVHLEFEGEDAPNPFTPVSRVYLGFIGKDGLEVTSLTDWHEVGEWIRSFQKFGKVVPVGYNIRNLEWPALTLNLAKAGEPLPGMMMPMEKKWSNLDVIDLQQLLVQGGYSDWRPALKDAAAFFGVAWPEGRLTVSVLYDLYKVYQRVS